MDVLIIPLVALAIPLIVAPTAIVFRHAQREREMEHAERMRALELGHKLPQDESWWTRPRITVLIAGVVPAGALGLAGFIHWFGGPHQDIWEGCCVVASLGLICGTYLASRLLARQPAVDAPNLKPQYDYDPDAFEVAGARG